MLSYLDGAKDVIACEVTGQLRRDDLTDLIERLKTALATNAKTHMFLQIRDLKNIDWRGVMDAAPHGLSLLADLNRFGRIAVVSDDKWVRTWTRVESALLPFVHYEFFHWRERQRALDWVAGRSDEPHAAALKLIDTNNPLVIAFELDGTITRRDIDRAMAKLEPRLRSELGPLNVLARVGEVTVSEPTSILDEHYIEFKKDVLARVDRYAVVGGPWWHELMVKALAPVLPFELRHFNREDEQAAWNWVGARSKRTIKASKGAPAKEAA
jgi:SpoIIAA-like